MYFEIWKNGNLIKRGDEILNDLSWDNELMFVPQTDITLPIEYREYLSGREEVYIYANDKCFPGIVVNLEEDKENETIEVSLEHLIREWTYRQISVNRAIKNGQLNVMYEDEEAETNPSIEDQIDNIYADLNFAYPGWELDFSDKAKETVIDYVYSKQDKLEALTKTMELTPDLFWRVGFTDKRVIEIGEFGEEKNIIISRKPSGANNVSLVSDPQIEHDFADVINLATVYSEKADSGMASMTLREVYNDPSLQIDGFPCIILRENVNNERDYSMYVDQFPSLAPNNELEYAVLDEESVALEAGQIIEGTFAFNDLSPFAEEADGETTEITDDDRIQAAKTAYDAAVRKLKQARRSTRITLTCEQLPSSINVGDKVRLIYDNSLLITDACSSYEKKILSMDDYFYITQIGYEISQGMETDTLTLEKELRIEREVN